MFLGACEYRHTHVRRLCSEALPTVKVGQDEPHSRHRKSEHFSDLRSFLEVVRVGGAGACKSMLGSKCWRTLEDAECSEHGECGH